MEEDIPTASIHASGRVPICVCVPARNEAARLPKLLAALADQDIDGAIPVAISLNNTTDDSYVVIERRRPIYGGRLQIYVSQETFPDALAHAGSARRKAMEIGLQVIGSEENAVLLTTDADARPPSNWVRANIEAISRGVDIAGGRLEIDDAEPLPEAVAAARRLWDRYWTVVRDIEDEIDPCDWDRPPRHGDHTGASLAIRARLYRLAGGVPVIPIGEDRALVHAAVAAGGRLSHPPDVWTRVSPRRHGRAAGGMARMMDELHDAVARGQTLMAPSLDHWRKRAVWRRGLRSRPDGAALIIQYESDLPPMPFDMPLADIVLTI